MLIVKQSKVGRAVRCLGSLLTTLALATGAVVLALSSPASAGPITYAFNPGSTTSLGGTDYEISGQFTVTTTIQPGTVETVLNSMSVTLSGAGSLAATYTGTGSICDEPDLSCIAGFAGIVDNSNELIVFFADPLSYSTDSLNHLSIILAYSPYITPNDFTPVGSVSPVPEPTSLALLGTAVWALKCQTPRGRGKRQDLPVSAEG